jgi:hypothetical protein
MSVWTLTPDCLSKKLLQQAIDAGLASGLSDHSMDELIAEAEAEWEAAAMSRQPKEMMKDLVHARVLDAFRQLVKEDGDLFECPIEEHTSYDARKLHEVCVNHRLANHLEAAILPVLRINERLFVDIEFNREGVDFKNIKINGKDQTVRPDIIIHNRRTGSQKLNFLVVEYKKQSAPAIEIENDQKKISAFMEDKRYEYAFGLQVIYGSDGVCGELFFKSGKSIHSIQLSMSPQQQYQGREAHFSL